MFAIQRLESILEILHEKGTVQVNELVKLLNVSDVTVRKDLNKLQEEGLITKTHGGAVLNKDISNQSLLGYPGTEVGAENDDHFLLAHHAVDYIHDGDTIFLGSGNSCAAFAKTLGVFNDLSVITNNVEAVHHLRGKCKTVILIGGEIIFHDNHLFTTSTQIDAYLSSYNINLAITSCTGVDMTFGISVSTEASKNIISAVLKVAKNWMLIADQSKFNTVSPYSIADINKPEIIVTNVTDIDYLKYKNIKSIKQ